MTTNYGGHDKCLWINMCRIAIMSDICRLCTMHVSHECMQVVEEHAHMCKIRSCNMMHMHDPCQSTTFYNIDKVSGAVKWQWKPHLITLRWEGYGCLPKGGK